jgi:hypothetical protein
MPYAACSSTPGLSASAIDARSHGELELLVPTANAVFEPRTGASKSRFDEQSVPAHRDDVADSCRRVVVAVLSLYRPPVLNSLDFGVYDTLSRALPTRIPSDRIVIVDVDERSLASIGQWPWRP